MHWENFKLDPQMGIRGRESVKLNQTDGDKVLFDTWSIGSVPRRTTHIQWFAAVLTAYDLEHRDTFPAHNTSLLITSSLRCTTVLIAKIRLDVSAQMRLRASLYHRSYRGSNRSPLELSGIQDQVQRISLTRHRPLS